MDRYVCIHGHFYQPPRENPWLEAVEYQESADPYHDWNERITAECYGPNTAARILDGEGRIANIINNYAKMSFNVGPTLLSWMEKQAPEVYEAILAADRASRDRFSGHGSALGQAYNHVILPLANQRDKRTQVLWGIRDFEHRFGRTPEGMWLPETAVDLETLEVLAEMGIGFTVLSPHQAHRVRKTGASAWADVTGGGIDPTMAYRQTLPSGKTIDLFFYDGPISRAVAFEGLLGSGEQFAGRLVGGFSESRSWPQIMHIATDGESYGHHHRHGEMALAYALNHVEAADLARLTIYGEYLAQYPPTHEVDIYERTAWSCAHGIDRWRADCGCSSGIANWKQAWRAPLRAALDNLRDAVAPQYEAKAGEYLKDPWQARDRYIEVVLDRSPENVRRFLRDHATRDLNREDDMTVLQLLELQRHAMLMYTSCGWFFDDISGIETVQVLQYAGRVAQLAGLLFGEHELERRFQRALELAKSNLGQHRDGSHVYDTFVKPAAVSILAAGAHYAVGSLFDEGGERLSRYNYRFEVDDYQTRQQGVAKLGLGHATVTSEITLATQAISFGVLHFGDQNLVAGVRPYRGADAYAEMVAEVAGAFDGADFAQTIRLLDKHFEGATYSFKSLFRDEQRRVLGPIVASATEEAEASCRQVYAHHAPLLAFFRDVSVPLPSPLKAVAQLVLNADLRHEIETGALDRERISHFLQDVRRTGIDLEAQRLERMLAETLERYGLEFRSDPGNPVFLERLDQAVEAAQLFPFQVDLWRVQNVCWEILHSVYGNVRPRARRGDLTARAWEALFVALLDRLRVRIPE